MESITVIRNGREISVELPVSDSISEVEIYLSSDANASIFEYSDVCPYAPDSPRSQAAEVFDPAWAEQEEKKRLANKDLFFPVVDIEVQADMEGVLEINYSTDGTAAINGNFCPVNVPVSDVMYVPADILEHWDNSVLLDPNENSIRSFGLRAFAKVTGATVKYQFRTLRDDWFGSIYIYTKDKERKLLGKAVILSEVSPLDGFSETGISRKRMLESLSSTVKYILACRNLKKDSPTYGGLFLLYDMDARSRLRSDWPWTWGPAATLLLRASEIDGLAIGMSQEELRKIAIEIADASLRQQITDPDHPARGLVRTTNEPGSTWGHGFENRASAADTLYLCGWGWMPFYKATGDQRYLEATKRAVEAAGRLMEQSPEGLIPQAYDLKAEKWIGHMFFESSMGLGGLGQLSVETGDPKYEKILSEFVRRLLDAFQREDGLWETWVHEGSDSVSSCNYFTKSFGYSAEGLMAVHEAFPEGGYLERAEKIAEHLLKAQAEDGTWTVRWDRPAEEVGITDKGTALWALLFLRLFKMTGK
jgi:hypothetical protein